MAATTSRHDVRNVAEVSGQSAITADLRCGRPLQPHRRANSTSHEPWRGSIRDNEVHRNTYAQILAASLKIPAHN